MIKSISKICHKNRIEKLSNKVISSLVLIFIIILQFYLSLNNIIQNQKLKK
jgi:hypothetical protein